ncbi:MAG TPA: methanogenesis marker 17 protein [Candidatus Acidoferrales bacterium]|nr:methanogenesis marker 17 protein [Candidatus Acidoferrales bacterium]
MESEKVIVVSPDERGAKLLEELANDILTDLNIARSIENIRIYVDPNEPVFILYAKLSTSLPNVRVSDVANMSHTEEGLKLDIKNEQYAFNLIDKLTEIYGRANILQLDRYTLLVATDEDIPDVVVFEPIEELKRKIIDSIRRIAPEGYRIIKHDVTNEYILFIASEEPLKDEWLEKGRALTEEMRGA